MSATGVVVLAAFLLAGSSSAISRCMDLTCQYVMDWTADSTSINITLTVNSSGWIGLGFSPNGGMIGSDIVTAYVDASGKVVLQDRHAVAQALPLLDAKQDYKLLSGQRRGKQLTVTFTRLLDTCDSDDMIIQPYTTRVIYAFGDLDSTYTPTYHTASNRGVVSTYLLDKEVPAQAEDGVFYIDPKPLVITIPADSSTTYWCSLIKMPTIANKSHVIALQPVIWANNTDLVHHMLVYRCDSANTSFPSYNLVGGQDGGNSESCSTLIGMWAVGGGDYVFPSEAGLPIGGDFGPEYILIQTHYNNVLGQAGRTDASYIRFQVTTKLRPNDAGIIQTGIVQGIFVPPNTASMNVAGYCTDDCLSSQNLPSGGIKVFAVGLHSHLLGRGITLRHFRPSQQTQLPVVIADPYYDFSYQEVRNLANSTVVLPGDILQTVCTMSSLNRNVTTLGGLSTMQEMCLSFLLYYPRTSIKLCATIPLFAVDNSDPIFSLLNRSSNAFNWFGGTYKDLDGVNWNDDVTSQIQAAYFNRTNYRVCDSTPHTEGIWTPPDQTRAPLVIQATTNPACALTPSQTTSATLRSTSNASSGKSAAMQHAATAWPSLTLWPTAAAIRQLIRSFPIR